MEGGRQGGRKAEPFWTHWTEQYTWQQVCVISPPTSAHLLTCLLTLGFTIFTLYHFDLGLVTYLFHSDESGCFSF